MIIERMSNLALKVRSLHWQVQGRDAGHIHEILDRLSVDLFKWIDRVAEDAFARGVDCEFTVRHHNVSARVDAHDAAGVIRAEIREILHEIDNADTKARSTGVIFDDIAEGLTNWLYMLSFYRDEEDIN